VQRDWVCVSIHLSSGAWTDGFSWVGHACIIQVCSRFFFLFCPNIHLMDEVVNYLIQTVISENITWIYPHFVSSGLCRWSSLASVGEEAVDRRVGNICVHGWLLLWME
jgi:hypothetical protein